MAMTKRRTRKQIEEEGCAFHEAGHAVIAWLSGVKIKGISMRPGIGRMAVTRLYLRPLSHLAYAYVFMAGTVAQELHERGRTPKLSLELGARGDYSEVQALMPDWIIASARGGVRRFLSHPPYWKLVEALAERLTPGTRLTGREVEDLLLTTSTGRPGTE